MSRSGAGTYSLPGAVNPVADGDTITANWANTTLNDIATALTNSLDRTGSGVMQAQLKAADGTVGAPGITFGTDLDSGLYAVAANQLGLGVNGANILTFTATAATFAATCFPTFAGVPTTGSHLVNKTYADALITGANWKFLKEESVTAVAAIDFINGTGGVVIDGTYPEYLLIISGVQSAAGQVGLRTTTDAGVSWDAGTSYAYGWSTQNTNSGTWASGGASAGTSSIPLGGSGEVIECFIRIIRPSGTTKPVAIIWDTIYSGSSAAYRRQGVGCNTANADVDGLRVYSTSGDLTAAGTIRLYGRRIA